MVKGERRKKREEIRRIVAEDERRRKEKEKKKDNGKKATYRKDKDGNVILFGNLRMSNLSIGVLVAIVGIAVFFYIVSTGVGEMDGYIEPEFSFESCQEDGFTADMCKFYYKHCRTYATGEQICEYAVENPFIDLPELGDKWTDEEQDFLPPTQFILPFAFGDNEPVCYSSACKNAHPNLIGGGSTVDPNITVKEARKSIEQLEIDIDKHEKNIRKWESEKDTWDWDLDRMEERYEKGEEEYDEEKTKYRHAFDVKVRTQDDIDDQNKASADFKKAQLEWKKIQTDWTNEQRFHDESYEKLNDAKNELKELEDELEEAMKIFDTAKIQNRIIQRGNNQFVNIILSDTCITMIENNMKTNCPTYTELRETWDNTIPYVSGEWVETEYDIKRENPKMEKHWNYYKQLPNWKIITVDPDNELKQIGVNIYIQATDFKYLERADSVLKNESIDIDANERYIWHNIKYDKYCSTITIAPDTDLLTEAINNIWDGCKTTVQPEVIESEKTGDFSTWTSVWTKYSTWLSDAMERCLEKC
jgi:hypothetical protein